jgi:hypothetical protein
MKVDILILLEKCVDSNTGRNSVIVAHFFFWHKRRKRKSYQKENAKRDFALCGARPKAPPLETASLLEKA